MSFHESGHRRTLVRRRSAWAAREEVNVILLAAATTAGTIAKAAWPPARQPARRQQLHSADLGLSALPPAPPSRAASCIAGHDTAGWSGASVRRFVSGRVWSLDSRRPLAVSADRVRQLLTDAGITSFALDPSTGDLLLCDLMEGRDQAARRDGLRQCTTAAGDAVGHRCGSATSPVSRRRRVVPYAPNASFWSDHATKRRGSRSGRDQHRSASRRRAMGRFRPVPCG